MNVDVSFDLRTDINTNVHTNYLLCKSAVKSFGAVFLVQPSVTLSKFSNLFGFGFGED